MFCVGLSVSPYSRTAVSMSPWELSWWIGDFCQRRAVRYVARKVPGGISKFAPTAKSGFIVLYGSTWEALPKVTQSTGPRNACALVGLSSASSMPAATSAWAASVLSPSDWRSDLLTRSFP